MNRLFTMKPAPEFLFKPTDWWVNVYWYLCHDGQTAIDDEWEIFARHWGGRWEYDWNYDGDRSLIPQSISFENDEDATAFLLRWS